MGDIQKMDFGAKNSQTVKLGNASASQATKSSDKKKKKVVAPKTMNDWLAASGGKSAARPMFGRTGASEIGDPIPPHGPPAPAWMNPFNGSTYRSSGLAPLAIHDDPQPRVATPSVGGFGSAIGAAVGQALTHAGVGGGDFKASIPRATSGMALTDLLNSIVPPSGPVGQAPQQAQVAGPAHYTPSLVDVAALLKPYSDAQGQARHQAGDQGKQILTLDAAQRQDTKLMSKVEAAHIAGIKAQYAQEAAALHAQLGDNAASAVGGVANQGADPAESAALQARGAADQQTGANVASAAATYAQGLSGESQLDTQRQQVDAQAGTAQAQQGLAQNLASVINALALQSASAKTSAEQQNAAATTDAQNRNAEAQQQYLQNVLSAQNAYQDQSMKYSQMQSQAAADAQSQRQQIIAQLGQSGGFLMPHQDEVLNTARDYTARHPHSMAGTMLQDALSNTGSADEALKYLAGTISQDTKNNGGTPTHSWDLNWFRHQIARYYQADTSQVSPEAAKYIRALYGK